QAVAVEVAGDQACCARTGHRRAGNPLPGSAVGVEGQGRAPGVQGRQQKPGGRADDGNVAGGGGGRGGDDEWRPERAGGIGPALAEQDLAVAADDHHVGGAVAVEVGHERGGVNGLGGRVGQGEGPVAVAEIESGGAGQGSGDDQVAAAVV